jgi:hypothetical protein
MKISNLEHHGESTNGAPKSQIDGEVDNVVYNIDEWQPDQISDSRRDQLNHTFSVKGALQSNDKYNYPDSERTKFASNYATRRLKNDHSLNWDTEFKRGLLHFDWQHEDATSDHALDVDSDIFERMCTRYNIDDPESDNEAEENEAWEAAGYESADLFGESIDKLAKVSGQYALCEAVKKLYKICNESNESDVPFKLLDKLDDKMSYLGKLVQRMDHLLIMHPQYDAAYMNDPWTLKQNQQTWSNEYGQAAWNKLRREIESKGALITETDCKEIAAKIDAQIAKVQGLLNKLESH